MQNSKNTAERINKQNMELTTSGNPFEVWRSTAEALLWFGDAEHDSKSANDFAEALNLPLREAQKWIQVWLRRGWLQCCGHYHRKNRGRPVPQYVRVGLPESEQELRAPLPPLPDVVGHSFVPRLELLRFFEEPRSIKDYARAEDLGVATVGNQVAEHVANDLLFSSGRRRGSVGPTTQLFCSEKKLALRERVRWQISEYERLSPEERAQGTELLLGWPIAEDGPRDRTAEFAEDLPDEMGARTDRED